MKGDKKAVELVIVCDVVVFTISFLAFLIFRNRRGDSIYEGIPRTGLPEAEKKFPRSLPSSSSSFLSSFEGLLNETSCQEEIGVSKRSKKRPGTFREMHPVKKKSPNFIKLLLQANDNEFVPTDVQLYLEFLKRGITVSLIQSIIAVSCLIPMNLYYSEYNSKHCFMDRASAGTLEKNSWRIWVFIANTIIYSLIVYWQIFKFHQSIVKVIQETNQDKEVLRPEKFTVLVKGIDESIVSQEAFSSQFKLFFPNSLCFSYVVLNYCEFRAADYDLKKALAILHPELRSRDNDQNKSKASQKNQLLLENPKHQTGQSVASSEVAPSDQSDTFHKSANGDFSSCLELLFLRRERQEKTSKAKQSSFTLVELNGGNQQFAPEVENLADKWYSILKEMLLKGPQRNVGVAFLGFKSNSEAYRCVYAPFAPEERLPWTIEPSLAPQDIVWDNVHVSDFRRGIRKICIYSALVTLSIFITSSAVFTNSLIPLANDIEKAIANDSFLQLSLTGWGAPLMLFAINSLLLPKLIELATVLIWYWRKSSRDAAILHGNAIFFTLNIVVFPAVGNGSIGAFLNRLYSTQIQEWNISLGCLILGSSGSFAIRYLLGCCFLSSASQLLQVPQYFYTEFHKLIHDKRDKWAFDFGYFYAFSLSIFFLMAAFAVVSPLVTPLCLLFFVMKYYVDKYNFMFGIWRVDSESAGRVAFLVLRYILLSVALSQFVMSGFLIAHGFKRPEKDSKVVMLSGVIFFIISTVTFSLVMVKSFMGSITDVKKPTDRKLTAKQEILLREMYTDPCKAEIQKYRDFLVRS